MSGDDWHDWKRLHAIEFTDPPRSPWRGLAELVWVALVVGLLAAWAARCWAPAAVDPLEALRAREDTAHVRVHRAQARTAAALDTARTRTTQAEAAVARYVGRRAQVPTLHTDTMPPRVALPTVPGGWGTVTDGTDTLPTPRAVIGALIARDSALTLADAAITEQRLALTRWAVAGQAFLVERATHEGALAAVQARMDAQIRAERARARRLLWTGAAVGLVGGLLLAR